MKKTLLLGLAVTANCFSMTSLNFQKESLLYNKAPFIIEINSANSFDDYYFRSPEYLSGLKTMLQSQAPSLSQAVIDKVITSLSCTKKYHIQHNQILTVIDYSRPSNEKRLWIFDLKANKLLFNTYVTHGIKSGTLLTSFFSNINNSKATSLGVYKTEKSYYGRDGISLRLNGLDRTFNDNAFNRYVVMHGGWYVEENFIKKYGRAGRSWGCPAVPLDLVKPIIDTIKNESLFVAYYPSDSWFAKSKFLNCNVVNTPNIAIQQASIKAEVKEDEHREDVLLASIGKNKKHSSKEVIAVVKADGYTQLFHTSAPLGRMLRRQINNEEYIALSHTEFKNMLANNLILKDDDKNNVKTVYFVEPIIKNIRGYYETQMSIVSLGKIKEVRLNNEGSSKEAYTVEFEKAPTISLRTTNQFIRWLGL